MVRVHSVGGARGRLQQAEGDRFRAMLQAANALTAIELGIHVSGDALDAIDERFVTASDRFRDVVIEEGGLQ
jgi:hypothetical protein